MKRFLPSIMWTAALVLLYCMDATSKVSLCLFKWLGFEGCWGCGIGHSIHHTLHFRFSEAVNDHILGIPATVALIWLIVKPFILKHTSYEPTSVNDAGHTAR